MMYSLTEVVPLIACIFYCIFTIKSHFKKLTSWSLSTFWFQTWPADVHAQCQLCLMTFSDESAISAHYDTAHAQRSSRREHPDASYECKVCGKKFTRMNILKRHLATVHSADRARHECHDCGRKFTNKRKMKLHVRTAHKNGSKVRARRTVTQPKSSLRSRVDAARAADAPKYECEICAKTFNRRNNLSIHRNIAHGIDKGKRFLCNVCSQSFTRSTTLRRHLANIHGVGDVTNFQCDLCTKTFTDRYLLRRHMSGVHKSVT